MQKPLTAECADNSFAEVAEKINLLPTPFDTGTLRFYP